MRPVQHSLGLFAVLGNWPNWESYFDLSRRGLKVSFVVLLASLLPLWVVATGIETERAVRLDSAVNAISPAPFVIVLSLWLLSFSALAYLITMIFDRQDRMRPWVITRHWAVFALSMMSGLAFALYLWIGLPFAVANGILFAAYFGLLAVDIRLAQKVAGFDWGTATLLSCVIVAVGLTIVILAVGQMSG